MTSGVRLAAAVSFLVFCASASANELPPISTIPDVTLCNDKSPLEKSYKKWYCSPLIAMNEPGAPLAKLGSFSEVYRFLWYRSFDPAVVVTIKLVSSTEGTVTVHALANWSGSETSPLDGNHVPDQPAPLDKTDISAIHAAIQSTNFWNLPTEFHVEMGFGLLSTPIPAKDEVVVNDGAIWIIEGLQNNRYHLIGDFGGLGSPVDTVGSAMLDLVRRKFPSFDVKPIY